MEDNTVVLRAIDDNQDPPATPDDKGRSPGPKDADWKELHTRMKDRDLAMLKDYDNEIDTLLVFAGLFSAILTAFIIDVYADLKVDSGDTSAQILLQILHHLQGDNEMTRIVPVKPHPSPITTVVLALWFVGLMLSLLAALFCIFMKQWLHAYSKWTDQNSLQQGLVLRDFYQAGLQRWRISDIFTTLGVLLQMALVLFVVGLVGYLWTLNFVISPFVTALAATMVALSISTIVLPVFNEDCPYRFPLAYVLLKFRTQGAYRDWAERDLPVAERVFGHGSAVGKAVKQTALLLDVTPDLVEEALDDHQQSVHAARSIRDRIRQLSPALTRALVEALTSSALFDVHQNTAPSSPTGPSGHHIALRATHWQSGGRPLVTPSSFCDRERLYCLWNIGLRAVDRPPSAILCAVRHLARTAPVGVEVSSVDRHHVPLLVGLIHQCGELCQRGDLPSEELAKIALIVDDCHMRPSEWSDTFTALHTLCYATRHIRTSVMHSSPPTGLSPITPYLELLARLQSRSSEARQLLSSHSQPPVQAHDAGRADLTALVDESASLQQAMAGRHAEFLCARRRGFSVSIGTLMAVFASDNRSLYVGTTSAPAWAINMTSYDVTTLTPLKHLAFNPCGSNFSRDGTFIIWGSRQGRALLVAIDDASIPNPGPGGRCLLLDLELRGCSRALALSWDNQHVLFGSDSTDAVLVDAGAGVVVRVFKGHAKCVTQAAFSRSPDELLATSAWDDTVKVWDPNQGTCLWTLADNRANAVTWSPDGSVLAISSWTAILIFARKDWNLQFDMEGHSALVRGLAFSPSGELLASCAEDQTVRVWNLDKRTSVAVLAGPSAPANRVYFSPDGSFLACTADDSVWIWEINPTSNHRVRESSGGRLLRAGRQVVRMQNAMAGFQPA